MFKPFDYFLMEKNQGLKGGSKDKNTKILDEYEKADDKDLLRHIKVAECAFDGHTKEALKNQKSFCQFLKLKEQRILFESYGLPAKSKQFPNIKLYWIAKNGLNWKDGESKWKSLDTQVRNQIASEYEKQSKEYEKNFFLFSRQLPENRVSDFIAFLETKSKNTNCPELKEFRTKHGPVELYYEKIKKTNPLISWNQSRTDFKALDDKKKLHYIKKCEEAFDQYKFCDTEAPILSQILTQLETKLLMDSYNMPTKPPRNLPGYYFKLNYHNFKEDHMKNVYGAYHKLSDTEREKVAAEFQKTIEEYKIKNAEFLQKIPKARLPDVAFLNSKGKSSASKKSGDGGETEDEETDHEESLIKNELLSDIDELNGFSQQMMDVDQRVAKLKVKTKLQTFIAESSDYSESAFNNFVMADLKSQTKMNKDESSYYLKNIAHKWYKLNDEAKEVYEDEFKKQRKEFKKSVKKFLKENSDLSMDVDTVKENIKEIARIIHVKLEDGTQEDIVLCKKTMADLVDSSVIEVEGGKVKKPKAVVDEEKNLKRKINDEALNSPLKKSA